MKYPLIMRPRFRDHYKYIRDIASRKRMLQNFNLLETGIDYDNFNSSIHDSLTTTSIKESLFLETLKESRISRTFFGNTSFMMCVSVLVIQPHNSVLSVSKR